VRTKRVEKLTENTLMKYLQQDHTSAQTPVLTCHPVKDPSCIVLPEYVDNLRQIIKATL
jgi:hypothetical protein